MDTKKITAMLMLLILVLNLLHIADARKKRKCKLRIRQGNPVCVDKRVKVNKHWAKVMMNNMKVKKRKWRKGKRLRLCASDGGTCQLWTRKNGKYRCRCVPAGSIDL